jgi:dienelactone hydrolase
MRRPSLRLAVTLALPLALAVAAWWIARPYGRAASLVVRSAGLERSHPVIAAWQRQGFVERDVTIPARDGPLRGRIYQPGHAGRSAVLLVPGVHAMGIAEPRLIGFARQLAATGLTVVTPEIPDLTRYAITPRSTDAIEDGVRWLAANSRLCPEGRVGLIGVSFAGGLSIVAAGRPSTADRLAFVLSFGGHGDFQRVMRYLCTGLEPDFSVSGRTAAFAASPPPAPGVRRPPHDYGLAVMTLDLAPEIVPPEQVAPLRQAILVFLEASHLAMFDTVGAEREFARAHGLEGSLQEPAATYLRLVNARDVAAIGARLLPHVAALGDDPALSPERSPAPRAPVFLLHGTDDNVIPAVESRLLARHLEGQTPVRLLLSPLITHAEVNKQAGFTDVWHLIEFWAGVLRR